MKTGTIITLIGFSILIMYAISQLLNFYGIGSNVYGVYFVFYAFILLSVLVLPGE